jgi:hypothetical protein
VHPAFRKGLLMCVGTLAWFYIGALIFDLQSPWLPWFNTQQPATKVKVGVWVFIGGMLAVDAVFLVMHGLRQGRIR